MTEKSFNIVQRSVREPMVVGLKDRRVFRGILKEYDTHINFVLTGAEEIVRNVNYLVIQGGWVLFSLWMYK